MVVVLEPLQRNTSSAPRWGGVKFTYLVSNVSSHINLVLTHELVGRGHFQYNSSCEGDAWSAKEPLEFVRLGGCPPRSNLMSPHSHESCPLQQAGARTGKSPRRAPPILEFNAPAAASVPSVLGRIKYWGEVRWTTHREGIFDIGRSSLHDEICLRSLW